MDKKYFQYGNAKQEVTVFRRGLSKGKYVFVVHGLTESQDGEELQHPSFDDFWNTFILSNSQWHQYHFTYVNNELKPFIISELNKELQGRPGDNIIVKNIAVIRGR
jgi:hypothetical protein